IQPFRSLTIHAVFASNAAPPTHRQRYWGPGGASRAANTCIDSRFGEAVRHTNRAADFAQVLAQLADECVFGEGSSDLPSIPRQRIKGAEEARTLGELAYERVHWHDALGL